MVSDIDILRAGRAVQQPRHRALARSLGWWLFVVCVCSESGSWMDVTRKDRFHMVRMRKYMRFGSRVTIMAWALYPQKAVSSTFATYSSSSINLWMWSLVG